MRTGISFLIKAASLSSVILLCLHVAGLAESPPARHLKIDYGRSAKYLPYDYDSLLIFNYGSDRISPVNIAQVLSASVDTTECVFVEILNPRFSEDRPPDINIRMIPGKRYEGFTSSVTVTDLRILLDSSCQCKAIVETGFRSDSAFAVKQQVLSDGTRLGGHLTAFLATGKDKTGDGKWQATTRIINAMDYDYDGRTEVFLHVDPLRYLELFLLVCLELETFRIEWTLPVSPTMLNGFLLSCNDHFNPGVMFVTNAPGFGVAGEFDGRFSYLARVDKNGKRIFRHPIVP